MISEGTPPPLPRPGYVPAARQDTATAGRIVAGRK